MGDRSGQSQSQSQSQWLVLKVSSLASLSSASPRVKFQVVTPNSKSQIPNSF
jgi:hypothetical protein